MTAVSEWAVACLRDLQESRGCEGIPLDRLLGDLYEPDRAVTQGHDCFAELLSATLPQSAKIMARVVFPLSDSETIDASAPSLENLQELRDEYQPPSLYLCDRGFLLQPTDWEEYRTPLPQTTHSAQDGEVHAYYTCYRDKLARERGWDYYRAVWFEHYAVNAASESDKALDRGEQRG